MSDAVFKVGVLAYVFLIILGIGLAAAAYTGDAYDIKKAENWIWRARATNDLNDMADYAQKALDEMDDLNGNPSWWFPAPDTDFDLIKTNIQEVIRNCRAFNDTMDTMAYQQAVSNLQETLVEIADHISLTRYWVIMTPYMAAVLILLSVLWIPIIIFSE